VRTAAYVVWLAAAIYLLLLLARMVIGWVIVFSRGWRPHGASAALSEIVYTLTDPPLKLVRRVVRPVRFGQFALDVSFMVVAFAVSVVAYVAARLADGSAW
jgi:YggT family protein